MNPQGDVVRASTVVADGHTFRLELYREDLSHTYPGLSRYTLRLFHEGKVAATFCTNSHEYSPASGLEAENVAVRTMREWEEDLRRDFRGFLVRSGAPAQRVPAPVVTDVVVLQGSPRPDGNCSTLAEWAAQAARECGTTAQVIFLGDLQMHPCIGCYQCYSTGTCVFADDMGTLVQTLRSARLLVICTPVYTNTVPGGLKIFIDRCQALHAERTFGDQAFTPARGLLLSVAGRVGEENFTCVTRVVDAFFRHLQFHPVAHVLADGMDYVRDVHAVPDLPRRVREAVRKSLPVRETTAAPGR